MKTAVETAEAAFPLWSGVSPAERGKPLAKVAKLIEKASSELARLDALSLGRLISTNSDAHYARTRFRYFAEAAYLVGNSLLNTPGFVNMSLRQSYGLQSHTL